MAGFNPLAALGANAVAAAQQAMEQSTLQIGVAAEVLQAQLSVGDLIAATILPAQGGSDLLQIFGQTVVAQLPTGVYPGETLLLAVTGFVGNSIMVQNLGVADPNAPLPTVDLQFPVEEGAPQTATLTTTPTPPAPTTEAPALAPVAPGAGSPQPGAPQPLQMPPSASSPPPAVVVAPRGSQPMAPPQAVFVAASVRPAASAAAASGPPAPGEPAPVPGEPAPAPIPAPPPPSAARGRQAAAAPPATEESDIEARITAVRTVAPDTSGRAVAPPPNIIARMSQRAPRVAPPIISRGLPQAPPIVRAAGTPASAVAASRDAANAQQRTAASNAVRVASSPEASLLGKLRIPVTVATTAAVRLMDKAAQAIPRTFSNLETALARVASDPRIASLRTALGFTGKLDPSNARALPEQIAAFVNDVLDGPEAKIAAIVRAFGEEPPSSLPTTAAANAVPTPKVVVPTLPSGGDDPSAIPTPVASATDASASVQARVAERVAALDYDVKAQILTLLQAPPAGGTPQLTQALNEALTAITALQLNALNTQNSNPNTISIPLPMFFKMGGEPTQLRIDRDGGKGERLDSGNFHVAFVLDTESLGMVAIDLQAANRSVNIQVKTERASAADRFRDSLGDLRTRLETLRYRVAAIGAALAPPRGKAEPVVPAQAPLPENRAPSRVDIQA